MFGAIAGGIASALAGGAMSKLFGGGQKAASGGIQGDVLATDNNTVGMGDAGKIGRASCRERVEISVGAGSLKKKLKAGRSVGSVDETAIVWATGGSGHWQTGVC